MRMKTCSFCRLFAMHSLATEKLLLAQFIVSSFHGFVYGLFHTIYSWRQDIQKGNNGKGLFLPLSDLFIIKSWLSHTLHSACVNLDFAFATRLLSRGIFRAYKINIHMDEIKRAVVCSFGMNTCRERERRGHARMMKITSFAIISAPQNIYHAIMPGVDETTLFLCVSVLSVRM